MSYNKTMRCLLVLWWVLVTTSLALPPPLFTGYALKEVASFEEGVDYWDPVHVSYAPHFWTTDTPSYSYQCAPSPPNMSFWSLVNTAWTPPAPDNVNWWHTLSAIDGSVNGYADMNMQLDLVGLNNFANWAQYDTFLVKWMGGNPTNDSVNLQIFVHSPTTPDTWYPLFYSVREVNNVQQESASLVDLVPAAALSNIDIIKFRVFDTYIPPNSDWSHFQRTHIFSVKVMESSPPVQTLDLAGITTKSGYLGTVYYSRYGRYSATGFWDENAGIYRVWAGGGIPEMNSCDNVWYQEFSNFPTPLDGEVMPPVRCTMNDSGVLYPATGPYGYGGDPTVVFVNGQFIMYFSGLPAAYNPSWNEVYRAVSSDGINWTLSPLTPVVAAVAGLAYGSGSPTVVLLNGIYYLWYYSQCEPLGGPPQPGLWFRSSSDGINFSNATFCGINTAADIKYVDALGMFVATYYSQVSLACNNLNKIGIAFSKDGINWVWDAETVLQVGQDTTACINSNPGWIGDSQGHGWPEMYLTYGASEAPFGELEYYTRQLEYSWVSMS